ncbi:unnamed protein product [Ixodes pacificus]
MQNTAHFISLSFHETPITLPGITNKIAGIIFAPYDPWSNFMHFSCIKFSNKSAANKKSVQIK